MALSSVGWWSIVGMVRDLKRVKTSSCISILADAGLKKVACREPGSL